MSAKQLTGFTLVEMLVAISLLGLLGVISWRGLDQVIAQHTRVSEQNAKIDRLIRTVAQIDRDIDQRVADTLLPIQVSNASALPRSLGIAVDGESRQRLTIVRRHPDAMGAIRVVYALDEGRLVRYSAETSDNPPGQVMLLGGIAAFQTRLLVQRGWVDTVVSKNSRASAIEVVIERTNGDRYTKVMPL